MKIDSKAVNFFTFALSGQPPTPGTENPCRQKKSIVISALSSRKWPEAITSNRRERGDLIADCIGLVEIASSLRSSQQASRVAIHSLDLLRLDTLTIERSEYL